MRECRVKKEALGCREPNHTRKSSLKDEEALQQLMFQSIAGRRSSGGDP